MPSYPTQLPYPLQQGYALQHVSPFARTTLNSGRARQRRTFTSVPSSVSVAFLFTQQEATLFEGWFRDDGGAGDGSNWFSMPLQTPLGDVENKYDCRFIEMYAGPQLVAHNKWQFTATLEVRERPIVANDYAIIMPDYIMNADIFDTAMNLEWPAA